MNWYLVVKVTKGVPSTFSSLPSLHLFIIIIMVPNRTNSGLSNNLQLCLLTLAAYNKYLMFHITITNSPLAPLLLHIKTHCPLISHPTQMALIQWSRNVCSSSGKHLLQFSTYSTTVQQRVSQSMRLLLSFNPCSCIVKPTSYNFF